jgi:acyl dehydratase
MNIMGKIMSDGTFSVPVEERYFEDYVAGSVHEFGSIAVEEEEIIAFASRYDPQIFHIDPGAAKKTVFGGLVASGLHTLVLMMRLLADHYVSHVASLGSPGLDELRWLKPVRPGDKLSVRVNIVETRRSQSKPDRGIVRSFVEVLNQNREVVMGVKGANIVLCRSHH